MALGRTYVEKVMAARSGNHEAQAGDIVGVPVDLVACDELSFSEIIERFADLGAQSVFDPERIWVIADHESPARNLDAAERIQAVRGFCDRHGIGHLLEGGRAGIVHVVVPELGLVGPGEVLVGYDSHVLTAGALGALAVGLGAADTAVALATGEVWLRVPETTRVVLRGVPRPWVDAKDVALELVRRLGQDGCLYRALEITGEYVGELPLDGRLTLTNMAIETGAKTALMPVDETLRAYLLERGRTLPEIIPWTDPDANIAEVLEFDVDALVPLVAQPGDPASAIPADVLGHVELDQVVIGTCTNGRLHDLQVAAGILRGRHVHPRTRLLVVPGSGAVLREALRDGTLEALLDAGAVVGPPGCGPCAGLHMGVLADGEAGLITSSRNFRGRMGGRDSSLYLSGPAVAAASAIAGRIAAPADVAAVTR
jgi:3-isopropylmalate/(R)-2-methylmalate dehydratase large subunit